MTMPRKLASTGADKQVSLFQSMEPPDLLRKAVQAIHIAPKSGKSVCSSERCSAC